MMRASSGDGTGDIRELLEVGVACLPQRGEISCFTTAAKQLVEEVFAEVHPERLPLRFLLLLTTADWCDTSRPLSKEVRDEIYQRLKYKVPLIGGSMARLFCSKARKFVMEQGVVLVAFCSRDFWMTVETLDKPHEKSPDDRREAVELLAKSLEQTAGIRLGTSASKHLLGIFPGIYGGELGQLHYRDNELHEEILSAFSYHYPLIGTGAANSLNATSGYQFANDKCLSSSLALAIVESDLAWGTRMGHGFLANREFCIAVDGLKDGAEAGYEVEILDGKPAAARLCELQETHSTAGGGLFLGLPTGEDYYVIRTLDGSAEKAQGCVRLTRRVRKGDRLYVLCAEKESQEWAAQSIMQGAFGSAETPSEAMKLIWGMSCTGRLALLNALQIRWEERVHKLATLYPGVPLIGGLCGGEFGIDQWGRAQANTFSFLASCIASAHSNRAKNRELQRQLIGAAGRLSMCSAPREVMEAALQDGQRQLFLSLATIIICP